MLWRKRVSYPGCPSTTGWASRLTSWIEAAGERVTLALSACLDSGVLSMMGLGAFSCLTVGLVLNEVQRIPTSSRHSMVGLWTDDHITIEVRPDSTFSYVESGSVPAPLGEAWVFIRDHLKAGGRFLATPGGPAAEITGTRQVDGNVVIWKVALRCGPGESLSGVRTVCIRRASGPCAGEFTTRTFSLHIAGSPR